MNGRRAFLALSLAGALSACGLSRPATEIHTYMIVAKPPERKTPRPLHIRVLPFIAASQFEAKPLIYRFSEVRYAADFYNEYLVAPTLMLPQQIAQWLRRAGHEATVDGAPDAHVLTGQIGALYGDFRDTQNPRAVLELRLALRAPRSDTVVFDQTYTSTVPIADQSAESLVEGLSTALSHILAEMEAELPR